MKKSAERLNLVCYIIKNPILPGPQVKPNATPPVTYAIALDLSPAVLAVDAYALRILIIPKRRDYVTIQL